MKTLEDIRKEAVAEYTGRAIFQGIAPEDLIQNIGDIATFVALRTAEAIKEAEHKKKIFILDTEKKSEEELEAWFAQTLLTHDVTSIDQIGKQRFAITTLENADDIK